MPNLYHFPNGKELDASQIRVIKLAALHMGLQWTTIAARPLWSETILMLIDKHGAIAAGCEEWRHMDQ